MSHYKYIKGNSETPTNAPSYNPTSTKYLRHMMLNRMSATLSSGCSLISKPKILHQQNSSLLL